MRPTDELGQEHQAIALMLRVLDRICKRLEARQKVSGDDLDQIIEFMRVFADQCHHAKEEGLLFVAMAETGMPREGGPIEVMQREHAQGRDFLAGLAHAVERYRRGEGRASEQIVMNARGYIELLTEHIDKEDNVLFPLAERVLAESKQRELGRQFQAIDRDLVGRQRHEQFRRLLERLKHMYLDDA